MEPGTKFVPMAERTKKLMAGAKKFRRRDAAGKRKAASGVKEDPKAREARLEVIFQSLAKKTGLPAKEVNTKVCQKHIKLNCWTRVGVYHTEARLQPGKVAKGFCQYPNFLN